MINKKTKQELHPQDIIGYFPHGLKGMDNNKVFNAYFYDGFNNTVFTDVQGDMHLHHFQPIIRPMSDINKIINIEGKTICVLREIAKEIFPEAVVINIDNADGTQNIKVYFGSDTYRLQYVEEFGDIYCEIIGVCEYICTLNEHQKIIDILNEYKIDYRGLIDAGLAIDVNTLENNCYENN